MVGFTEFLGGNQNYVALILGGLSIAAAIVTPPLYLTIILISISIFTAFLITMYNNLALIEAGCPEKLIKLNWFINIVALSVGIIFGSTVAKAILLSIVGWIYTSSVSSDSIQSACRNFGS